MGVRALKERQRESMLGFQRDLKKIDSVTE